jgi:hypothetical protein
MTAREDARLRRRASVLTLSAGRDVKAASAVGCDVKAASIVGHEMCLGCYRRPDAS